LFFVESALLHGFLVARKPSSQDSTGPKIPRQVNTKERTIFVEEESELLRFLKAGYVVFAAVLWMAVRAISTRSTVARLLALKALKRMLHDRQRFLGRLVLIRTPGTQA